MLTRCRKGTLDLDIPDFIKVDHDQTARRATLSVVDPNAKQQREMWGMNLLMIRIARKEKTPRADNLFILQERSGRILTSTLLVYQKDTPPSSDSLVSVTERRSIPVPRRRSTQGSSSFSSSSAIRIPSRWASPRESRRPHPNPRESSWRVSIKNRLCRLPQRSGTGEDQTHTRARVSLSTTRRSS